MPPDSVVKRYTMTGGENTYSSPAATNPEDVRKLQSLIPSLSGALERERPPLPFATNSSFPSRVGFFHQYKRNNSGVITYYYFCATATALYVLVLVGTPNQVWSQVSLTPPLANFPVAVNINNIMHFSDGVNSWQFDGTNFLQDGLPIPAVAPVLTAIAPAGVAISTIVRVNGMVTVTTAGAHTLYPEMEANIAGVTDTTFAGTFPILTTPTANSFTFAQPGFVDSSSSGGTINNSGFAVLANRYYWTTYDDQSTTHPHESSSSPTSLGTGPLTSKQVRVFMLPGTITVANSSPNVAGIGTAFSARDVGKALYIPGTLVGTIASVTDAQNLVLTANALVSLATTTYTIAPTRVTHWNIYASSSEEDKIGNFLISVPINVPYYIDFCPMIGTTGVFFSSVQRPLLNDPPDASAIMDVHKNRIWRRKPTFPNIFTYTGNEEILAEQAGTPSECVPGADDLHTVSPGQVNETSYPDQSAFITGIRKHGDALYIGSEDNVIPLYGSSLADFDLSEAQAFAVGFAGRRASVSTPFGLAFVSYDLKVYLYPSQYSFGVDSTTALVELGRPKRTEFETIDGTDFPNMHLVFYNWGRRNWLVLQYRRNDATFATWVFDFETKGWMQMQQGYTAIGVFEMTPGKRSLIAASAADNKTYVIDDLTGNFPVPPATNYPVGYLRQLFDFGNPDTNFAVESLGYEVSDRAMKVDVTIWLDPVDVDNPGVGIPIAMVQTKLGANSYMGRPNPSTGGACQRVLVEYAVAANAVAGRFHGYTTEADKMPVDPVL